MSSDIDPVVAMYRANQAFHGQVLQTAPLSCGTAYFSTKFGLIGNQVREVAVPAGGSMAQAHEEVQAFFSRLPHPCRVWSPQLGQPSDEMERFLVDRGYNACRKSVMALQPWPELPSRPEVRVLPGRAMKAALCDLLVNDPGRGSAEARAISAEMLLARLDDPQFDVLLAMAGGRAAGHACLLQVGPIAAIYDLYVREEFRRRGFALALLHDLVTTCRRLELRTVVLEVAAENAAAIRLYERCGFRQVGESVEVRR